jgi:predicted deacylase
VHGDEYEGPIVLGALARRLDPERLRGRVIIVPCANPPAVLAGRRTSPIDHGNLARLFPGDPKGSPTSQIAEGITRLLLPEIDYLVDLHSGGSTLEYLPCAFGRLPAGGEPARRTLDLLTAFGAPLTAVVMRPEASGTLVSIALERGITAMATELGGCGGVTKTTLSIANDGLRRVLCHIGLNDDKLERNSTRLMGVEPKHYVRAPGRGLFEPCFELGDLVRPGDTAGLIWDPERLDRAPDEIVFGSEGIVICRRMPAVVEAGDVLAHLAEDVSAIDLMSR